MAEASFEIRFSASRAATGVVVPPRTDGPTIVRLLALPRAVAVVVVNGGTAGGPTDPAVAEALELGVGRLAIERGWTVVTGGTDAGIFALLGSAATARRPLPAPWIGVAPLGRVTWPEREDAGAAGAVALEPNHSHVVLVEGDRWGDETPALLALVAALGSGGAPSAAVVAGGGSVTRSEVAGHRRAGRPVIALAGSGRLADELAAEAAGDRDLRVCDGRAGPGPVAATLVSLLGETRSGGDR